MSEEFTVPYAAAYDALYREKDYAAECDLLEAAFERHGRAPVERVLDLGCGTGNHALPLAERGYRVTGVDRSAAMLESARAKAATLDSAKLAAPPSFTPGDVRTADLGARFDAALLMFAVLGYQLENADVQKALATARRHLEPGGLLIFDVWYGPAVLAERPGERVKVVDLENGERLIRATDGQLDSARHLCAVTYRLFRLAERGFEETRETHRMRFFFPQELRLFLEWAGFETLSITAFPSLDEPCSERSWNALVVAAAVSDVAVS